MVTRLQTHGFNASFPEYLSTVLFLRDNMIIKLNTLNTLNILNTLYVFAHKYAYVTRFYTLLSNSDNSIFV